MNTLLIMILLSRNIKVITALDSNYIIPFVPLNDHTKNAFMIWLSFFFAVVVVF